MDPALKQQLQTIASDLTAYGLDLQKATTGSQRIALILSMRNRARRARAQLADFPRGNPVDAFLEQLAIIEENAGIVVDGFPDVSAPERWVGPIGAATAELLLIVHSPD